MEAILCDSKSLSSDQDGTNDQANIAIQATLCDSKRFDQISVILWGDLAEIEISSLENLKDAKPVVALLRVIGRCYLGEFQLSTKSSTLVLVNPEIPQCREMIDWYNLRLEVNDGTDTAYVTLFDEVEILIGCTAIAYVEMFEDESSECYQKMKSCLEKEYVFLVKISEKEESNRKVRCIIAQEVRKVEKIHPPTVETEETGKNKVIDARKRLFGLKSEMLKKKMKMEPCTSSS
ncbi:uncharacterized protein A4U43_C07F9420 [Asparagus officinalis]|uniref:Replication factor A C-terminal domain-containing protein n=1 Tax=Asparagus officinalis TaxID=4686 RepID=A0A5P1EAX6_ASPOF|nr:uncharacterized protein A4U43_C07F9420 [Asparagus officinalis]